MTNAQMELGFGTTATTVHRRNGYRARANWWFEQMRQLVDRAFDWQPTPSPRPEQIWLPGSNRQISTSATEK